MGIAIEGEDLVDDDGSVSERGEDQEREDEEGNGRTIL
jgi:hypothetical protein